jgi:hypothetical protein
MLLRRLTIMSARIKISPPWVAFYHEIEALFGEDPEVKVGYDERSVVIKLYVDNPEKAHALTRLLPAEKTFGNIVVGIQVIPVNGPVTSTAGLFRQAFEGNPAFSYVGAAAGPFADQLEYVVFRNEVVQFYNDDIGDINGMETTLYQEIAKDVFEDISGIFFCTDLEGNPGKPVEARP